MMTSYLGKNDIKIMSQSIFFRTIDLVCLKRSLNNEEQLKTISTQAPVNFSYSKLWWASWGQSGSLISIQYTRGQFWGAVGGYLHRQGSHLSSKNIKSSPFSKKGPSPPQHTQKRQDQCNTHNVAPLLIITHFSSSAGPNLSRKRFSQMA